MDPAYERLPTVGPNRAMLGSALVTMVDPDPGFERAYNRWYEDDHYYAGALAMPWVFAGRRWVASPALRAARRPQSSAVAQPVTAGRYISLYWIVAGRSEEHIAWSVATNKRLRSDGRGFEQRSHVYTSFMQYLGASYRDPTGPRDLHALDYPYRGLAVEVLDATGPDVAELDAVLADTYLPELQRSGVGVAQTLRFRPQPLPKVFSDVQDMPNLERRITLLHFLDREPDGVAAFPDSGAILTSTGVGTVEFIGEFQPTLPGTDQYVEQT